jgi:hypothetical protein
LAASGVKELEDAMKTARNFCLGLLLSALAASAQADSNLLSLVMPDAKVLSGIRIKAAKTSAFGNYVLSQMNDSDAPGVQKFIADTGFDPRRDLDEIVAATSGTSESPNMLIAGSGSFNPSQILNAARDRGAKISSYKGFDLIVHEGEKGADTVALSANTALIGKIDTVKAAIDRIGTPLSMPADLQAKVQAVSSANDAWFVSTGPLTDFFTGKIADPKLNQAMQGNLLQAILEASGGLKFNAPPEGGVLITGQAVTRSEKDAAALADVVKFVAGLVQLNAGDDQRAQEAASVLRNLQVTTSGATTQLSLAVSESYLEQLFMPPQHERKAPQRARPRRSALVR